MENNRISTAFVHRLSSEALNSYAVTHPYLRAISQGGLANMDIELQDFAHQYGVYSAQFTHYLMAVIDNLEDACHRSILLENLREERGNVHDVDLTDEVLESIIDVPHNELFKRFQCALGVDDAYSKNNPQCHTAVLWSKQFLNLCQTNQYVGIGAIGMGTELIVSSIYKQILTGLERCGLSAIDRVFFDLHSECDDDHAQHILSITEDLATDAHAREQIEFGARMAIKLRIMFWDKMYERAQHFSESSKKTVTAIGY